MAATAAEALGCSRAEASEVRAAGFFHDLGRVAVPNGIWDKPGPLSAGEWERVRLHPYYTERVLERSGALAPLARLSGSHHERLDGSGYHRGASAAELPMGARVLAAADAFDAMTHDRPYRRGSGLGGGAGRARRHGPCGHARPARCGCRSRGCGRGAAARAAEPPRRAQRPRGGGPPPDRAGPTSREIAEALLITEKTAGHHVEHIYAKTGVTTRVGAALFAMRHDLVE